MLKKLENKSKSQVPVGNNNNNDVRHYHAHLEVNNQNQNQLVSPYQLQQPVLPQQQQPQHKKQKTQGNRRRKYDYQNIHQLQQQQKQQKEEYQVVSPYQLQQPQQKQTSLPETTIEKIQLSKKKLEEILEIAFLKLSLTEEMKKSYINLLVYENSDTFLLGDLTNHEKLEKLGIKMAGPRLKIINYFKINRPEIKDLSDKYETMYEEIEGEKELENLNNNAGDIQQQPQQSKTTRKPHQKHDDNNNDDEEDEEEEEEEDEEDEDGDAMMKKKYDDNKKEEEKEDPKDEKQAVMQREYTITSRPAVEKHYVDSKQMYVVFYININNQ